MILHLSSRCKLIIINQNESKSIMQVQDISAMDVHLRCRHKICELVELSHEIDEYDKYSKNILTM